MKSHTLEDAAFLSGYVDGYLAVKFYHLLLLAPQLDEKLTVKVLGWPLSVLHAFLSDDTPPVRTISIDESEITISQRKEHYIQTFHSLCRRYGMYPRPKSGLEQSFITAMAMIKDFGVPEKDFAITPQKEVDVQNLGSDAFRKQRNELYNKYGIDPGCCSATEHDFIYAMAIDMAGKADFQFRYLEPKTDDADDSTS